MEPKVIQKCLKSGPYTSSDAFFTWEYNAQNAIFKQGGSGNNWALGYNYYDDQTYE
jgi:hypothetical protein